MCVRRFLRMKRITFSIPKDLKEKLDRYPDINWPDVIKKGLKEWLVRLEKLEALESRQRGGVHA